MAKKPTTIKIINRIKFNAAIKFYILEHTNSQLISMGMHNAIVKFMDELEKVPLSQELQ